MQAYASTRQLNNLLGDLIDLPNKGQIDQVLGGLLPIKGIGMQSGTKDAAGLIEERENTETSYPLKDGHGDITTVTDNAGNLVSRHSYDPWGKDSSTSKRDTGYLGAYLRRSDIDTGLTQMGARQYAPDLGRFTSEDPVLGHSYLGQSWNRHSYVMNRPLVLYDLDGEMPWGPKLPSLPTHKEIGKGIWGGGKAVGKAIGRVYSGNGDSSNGSGSSSCSSIIIGGAQCYLDTARSVQWKDIEAFGQGCLAGGFVGFRSTPSLPYIKALGVGAGCIAGGYTQASLGINVVRSS